MWGRARVLLLCGRQPSPDLAGAEILPIPDAAAVCGDSRESEIERSSAAQGEVTS